ncbi:transposase family protein [Rhodococcus sp. LW-XY12]|uniref:transposase family protein n=1 Tax=Rhodococcus sp. LW-XY12 TaxID=2856851 RepID=UPI0027D87F14|nr:transposase family protein [Rhodococcus sp. LW-XY12]
MIRIEARPRDEGAVCPRCDGEARRVHSRYRRQLADTAIGGYPVLIDTRVRRFFCDTIECATKTFAEPAPTCSANEYSSADDVLGIRHGKWARSKIHPPLTGSTRHCTK